MYVSLEPCNHFGRVPPCTDAIIKSGIERVVCPFSDPNPKVNGRGIQALRRAGIKVEIGAGKKEAKELNEAFITFHAKRRPFVAVKFAASLDGKIATTTGDSKWITNLAARKYAHYLRSIYQAVIVGATTVRRDNPHLGSRLAGRRDPLRIIIDGRLSVSPSAQVFRDGNALVVASGLAPKTKLAVFKKRGIDVILFKTKRIPLKSLLQELFQREIVSVMVEGGGDVIGNFFDEKFVDKVHAFTAPIIIGGEKAVSAVRGRGIKKISGAQRLKNISRKKFGEDWLISGNL